MKRKRFSRKELFQRMIHRHQATATRQGAVVYNLGFGVGRTSIFSKTSRGGLESTINPGTGRCSHKWLDS